MTHQYKTFLQPNEPFQSGGHRLNHCLNEAQEFEREYYDSLEDFELTRTKFYDATFLTECEQIERVPKTALFMNGILSSVDGKLKYEIDVDNIKQGKLGDCWFMSSGHICFLLRETHVK